MSSGLHGPTLRMLAFHEWIVLVRFSIHRICSCNSNAVGHCATSRKVAGSIPDEVIGFFSWPNPSSRIVALGSTQFLTELSTRNIRGVKELPAREADKLTAICDPIENVGASTSHNPVGLHRVLQGCFTLPNSNPVNMYVGVTLLLCIMYSIIIW
jgi:hypothetical protein